jgi:hypothetical protein
MVSQPVPYHSEYGVAPMQLNAGAGDYNISQLPQLDSPYTPDMVNAMQLAPTMQNGANRGMMPMGRISQPVYDKLGFDLYAPFMPKPEFSMTDDSKIDERIDWLEKEKQVINQRLIRVSEEYNFLRTQYDASVQSIESDISEMQREIADLEQWLHQASKKEKARISEEIGLRDRAIQDAHVSMAELTSQSNILLCDINILQMAQQSLYEAKAENEDSLVKVKADIKALQLRDEKDAPERLRIRAEKISRIRAIMADANKMQLEDDTFETTLEFRNKEKEFLKTENATLQHAILSTSDLDEVVSVSEKIQYNNQAIMELDRKNSEDLRNRSSRPVSIGKLKRDAEGIIKELKLSYNDVVTEEDSVLIDVARITLIDQLNEAKRSAQDSMLRAQHRHDHLVNEYHKSLTDAAFNISNAMREAEEEVMIASEMLNSIVAKLALATGAEANLLAIEKLSAEDALQLAKVNAERMKAMSIKDRIEAKAKLDNDILEASKEIESSRREYDNLVVKQRQIDSEATSSVISGSGVISNMTKEI